MISTPHTIKRAHSTLRSDLSSLSGICPVTKPLFLFTFGQRGQSGQIERKSPGQKLPTQFPSPSLLRQPLFSWRSDPLSALSARSEGLAPWGNHFLADRWGTDRTG
jgi:hypothetical protein